MLAPVTPMLIHKLGMTYGDLLGGDSRVLHNLWDDIDTDGNGRLSKKELQPLIAEYLKHLRNSMQFHSGNKSLSEMGDVLHLALSGVLVNIRELTVGTLDCLIADFKKILINY
eukprot:UN23286